MKAKPVKKRKIIRENYTLHISKQYLKFSSAHFTLFPDGSQERLHGHNYTVTLDVALADASFKKMASFQVFKDIAATICEEWDERVLIPKTCPLLTLRRERGSLQVKSPTRVYVFPEQDVALLDCDNITVEMLAKLFFDAYAPQVPEAIPLTGLIVRIDESSGQGASYSVRYES